LSPQDFQNPELAHKVNEFIKDNLMQQQSNMKNKVTWHVSKTSHVPLICPEISQSVQNKTDISVLMWGLLGLGLKTTKAHWLQIAFLVHFRPFLSYID